MFLSLVRVEGYLGRVFFLAVLAIASEFFLQPKSSLPVLSLSL